MHAKDDWATLSAVGALAAIFGSLVHEDLGHSLFCMAGGGHVSLVTFLEFQCAGGNAFTGAAGPLAALSVGAVAILAVMRHGPNARTWRVFLFISGILMMFWTWAQLIRNSLDGSDDWGYAARGFDWPQAWHGIGVFVGLIGYGVTAWIALKLARRIAAGRPRRLLLPWLSAVFAAILLGAIWHGARQASALDGFMTFGAAAIGFAPAIRAADREPIIAKDAIRRSWTWISVSLVAFIGFASTIAHGWGSLASV